MSKCGRRNHVPAFKAKAASAAVRGEETFAELPSASTCTRTRLRSGKSNAGATPADRDEDQHGGTGTDASSGRELQGGLPQTCSL